ncbi:MAG: sugar ABC transporter permease [Lachnospiraceae bacterium]|nr:sugar ABC transporter permease [Lachnospiraceae bacterium]
MNRVRRNKTAIILFIIPTLILFCTIIIVPIFMDVYYSFFKWNGMTAPEFIGADNYIELFSSKAMGFPRTIKNAFILAGLSVFIQLPISLFMAIVLARGVKWEKFFVALFFTPVLISTVVIGQLWLKMYNPQYGIINSFLRLVGLDNLCRTWLGDGRTALPAVFVPILWQYIGYHMLLLYAGVKSIPEELNEAAKIDGANSWQIARLITIPNLKPTLQVCTIFAITGSLKAFDLIYVLTGGGPAHASEVPSTLMVDMIFGRSRYGIGSTIAVFIIFLCFFFAVLIKKVFKTEVD